LASPAPASAVAPRQARLRRGSPGFAGSSSGWLGFAAPPSPDGSGFNPMASPGSNFSFAWLRLRPAAARLRPAPTSASRGYGFVRLQLFGS